MLPLLALAAASAAPNDYTRDDAWLCRPGRADVCAGDLDETVVTLDARTRLRPAGAERPADIDCFYVYPTVSLDAGGNSDMIAGREEQGMTVAQFAPFRSACRPFAPLYRQITLTALRKAMTGATPDIDRELPYRDVLAAFRDYLARDNKGRPFVLVGQSQGAMMLKRLVAEEIDGKPLSRQLVSAILPGTSVMVPEGKDVGGTFKATPLCRSEAQTGCIVTWATYRDGVTLPDNTLFGTGRSGFGGTEESGVAGCTNPARLAGGRAPLDPILGYQWWKGGVGQYEQPATGWSVNGKRLTTRFVAMPGLLSGECTRQGKVSYLAVRVTPTKAEVADTVVGTAAVGDKAYPDWGFHVIDMAVVEGDLVRMVRRQAAAWKGTSR
jgi:hypothetical protein